MSELRELYQTTILDHNRRPRNFRAPDDANRTADGHNPLCGDKIRVFLKVEDDRVTDAAFQGAGCAISTASASLMTEAVKGRSASEVMKLFDVFHELVAGARTEEPNLDALGKLAVFEGVREFPVRVKCATLAWHTLRLALEGRVQVAKTE